MGRKIYKYTPEVHAEIVRNLNLGCFKKHAAEAAGVSREQFLEWVRLGQAGREPFVQFAADVEKACATDALRNQAIITRAAQGKHDGDWKAAAWNLERKHPTLYGSAAVAASMRTLHTEDDLSEKPRSPWKLPANDNASAPRKQRLDA